MTPSTDSRADALHVQDIPARASGEPHADPYVLLHGWGCRSTDWQPLIECLSEHARVVAVDLPGHGQSPPSPDGYSLPRVARSVSSVLDQLQVGRATLMGHSAGAEVALAMTLAEPSRTGRMVSVDPAYGFAADDRARISDVAGRLDREDPASVAAEYFALIEGPSTGHDLVESHAASARAADPDAMRGVFRQFAFGPGSHHFHPDLDEAMARRRAPLLAIYRNTARAESGRAVATHPGDAVEVQHGCGHWLHQEQPELFLRTLREWESGTVAASHT